MAESTIRAVSDQTFEHEVLQQPGLVLVDFYTAWCPPCHKVLPELESLYAEHAAKIKVVKLDAEENLDTAAEHAISTVPSFVLYRDGKLLDKTTGYHSKQQFENWIGLK